MAVSTPPDHALRSDFQPLVTLEGHMLAIERRDGAPTGALSWVLSSLGVCARMISSKLRR